MYRLGVVITFAYNFFVTGIHVQNSFISKSTNLMTVIGETVEFKCSDYNIEFLKYTTQLIWYKNEEPLRNIIEENSNRIFLDASGDTLTITNVTKEDAGTYKCYTFNQSHNDYSIYTLAVNGQPKPKKYHRATYNKTVSIGWSVYISCKRYILLGDLGYSENQQYTYFKDGKPLFLNESDRRIWVDEYSFLNINNFTNEDKGTYECVISNKIRSDHTLTNLNVVGIDKRSQKHQYDEIMNLTKHLNEEFSPEYCENTWFKNDRPFKSSKENTHVKFYNNDSKFYIDNLTFEDAGTYICNSSNEYAYLDNEYITLNVIDPPEKLSFILFTSNISVVFGETIELKCHIFQSTIHYITWYSWKKNGEPVVVDHDSKNMYLRYDQSILQIYSLASNDMGSYECEAESYYHKVYSTYTLIIAGNLSSERPVGTATVNQLKKNIEKVYSILVYLAFNELFILIGCVTICCIWWLRRRQTT